METAEWGVCDTARAVLESDFNFYVFGATFLACLIGAGVADALLDRLMCGFVALLYFTVALANCTPRAAPE